MLLKKSPFRATNFTLLVVRAHRTPLLGRRGLLDGDTTSSPTPPNDEGQAAISQATGQQPES